jgi:hypothetical protein
MAVTAQKVGVLKISTRVKREAEATSPVAKGKQTRIDVGAPSASVAPRNVSLQPPAAAEADDDRVAYYAPRHRTTHPVQNLS